MGLKQIREYLTAKGIRYDYHEDFGCGSIDFIHRGLSYHIWEFPPEDKGAESNVRTVGRMDVYTGDYERQILDILKTW